MSLSFSDLLNFSERPFQNFPQKKIDFGFLFVEISSFIVFISADHVINLIILFVLNIQRIKSKNLEEFED